MCVCVCACVCVRVCVCVCVCVCEETAHKMSCARYTIHSDMAAPQPFLLLLLLLLLLLRDELGSLLNELDVVGGEKAKDAAARTLPPSLVNLLNVCDNLVGVKGQLPFLVCTQQRVSRGHSKEQQTR